MSKEILGGNTMEENYAMTDGLLSTCHSLDMQQSMTTFLAALPTTVSSIRVTVYLMNLQCNDTLQLATHQACHKNKDHCEMFVQCVLMGSEDVTMVTGMYKCQYECRCPAQCDTLMLLSQPLTSLWNSFTGQVEICEVHVVF